MFTNYVKDDGDIIEHECIIKGDGKFASISLRILAKTYHDDYIENLLGENPDLEKYGWKTDMCYGTSTAYGSDKKYGSTISRNHLNLNKNILFYIYNELYYQVSNNRRLWCWKTCSF